MKIKTATMAGGAESLSAISESPTEKVVRESRPMRTVTDELGRKVTYRQLSVLDEARIARFLGSELAGNSEYMKYVRIACAVQSIDGDTGIVPNKLSFVEKRIEWVGDEGFLAVHLDMIERYKAEHGQTDEEDEPLDEREQIIRDGQERKNG